MGKRMITLLMAVCLTTVPMSVMAEELAELSPSKIAGYYHTEEVDILILANGKAFSVDTSSMELLRDAVSFTAYGNADDFIIEDNNEYALFSMQKDKGTTENGGTYYAVYEDYLGTEEETDFQEGKHVKYGNYVFGNDYAVCERDSLNTFFGEVIGDGISGRMEGDGFETPEDALGAYIEGLKANDINAMIAAFAVETLVENYSIVKMVDLMQSYNSAIPYLPNVSDYSTQLNVETRRAEIMESIRGQYLVLQGSKVAVGDSAYMPITLRDTYDSASEMVDDLFVSDDTMVLGAIEFNKDYYDPDMLSDSYSSEDNRKLLEKRMAVYGAEDIAAAVTKFYSNGAPYVLMADTIKYNGRWYLNSMGGNIGAITGAPLYNYGLIPLQNEEFAELFGE